MHPDINAISLPLLFGIGMVNCYLIKSEPHFLLIDTGASNSQKLLDQILERAGCQPGDLTLIILTHGDFDHTGNAAHLRKVFGCKIAMHVGDAPMAERGDMFIGRKRPGFPISLLMPALAGFGRSQRFTPDLPLRDGDDLAALGLEARVISVPGHSRGSIAILTADGDLFCGDLLESTRRPAINSMMDDVTAGHASLQSLSGLNIRMIYPGHGRPFMLEELVKDRD